MIIDNLEKLQGLLISKPGYFETVLNNLNLKFDQYSTDWWSIGMDDLDFIEMIMQFEKDFNIKIVDELSIIIERMKFQEFYKSVSIVEIRENKLNDLGI